MTSTLPPVHLRDAGSYRWGWFGGRGTHARLCHVIYQGEIDPGGIGALRSDLVLKAVAKARNDAPNTDLLIPDLEGIWSSNLYDQPTNYPPTPTGLHRLAALRMREIARLIKQAWPDPMLGFYGVPLRMEWGTMQEWAVKVNRCRPVLDSPHVGCLCMSAYDPYDDGDENMAESKIIQQLVAAHNVRPDLPMVVFVSFVHEAGQGAPLTGRRIDQAERINRWKAIAATMIPHLTIVRWGKAPTLSHMNAAEFNEIEAAVATTGRTVDRWGKAT